jgi:flagellar FliL protein
MTEDLHNTEAASAPQSGGGRKLLIGGAIVALLAAGIATAVVLTNKQPSDGDGNTGVAAASTSQPALYLSLHPPLVVNLTDAFGAAHFMQVTLEVMARKQDVINAAGDHAPVIRNSLILLYGSEKYEDVVTREGKEKMLADGLAEIRKVMKEQSGLSGVEAVYFTSLIIQ